MSRAKDSGPGSESIYGATLAETHEPTPEISTEDMRRIARDRSAVILDTRVAEQFEAGHIAGAINLDGRAPGQPDVVSALVGGDKSTALVLYCNGPFCKRSRELARELAAQGFSNVSRYQLGIPIWRALGGPTIIELNAIKRNHGVDRTAVYYDARSLEEFALGHLAGAVSVPVDDVASGKLERIPLPEDDYNRRVIVYGRDGEQALQLAHVLAKRPLHNVVYFPGTFAELAEAVGTSRRA